MKKFSLQLLFLMALCACIPQRAYQNETSTASAQTAVADTAIAAIVQTHNAASSTPSLTPSSTPDGQLCNPQTSRCVTLTPTVTQTSGPSPTPTLLAEFFHGSYAYQIDFTSQVGLRYNGKVIQTGCTAACVEMVLNFWHAWNAQYPTLSAQQIIDLNAKQHMVHSEGLNIQSVDDELEENGYYLGIRTNSEKQELLDALERYGPLLVLTKAGWQPLGANHMAVVTFYDEDNDRIRLMDPMVPGGIVEYDYGNFDGIWSLNYCDDANYILQRSFFFIVPVRELRAEDELFIPNMDNPQRK